MNNKENKQKCCEPIVPHSAVEKYSCKCKLLKNKKGWIVNKKLRKIAVHKVEPALMQSKYWINSIYKKGVSLLHNIICNYLKVGKVHFYKREEI